MYLKEKYNDTPILQSYRAAEWLYAGEYPGDKGADRAADKLKAFCDFGITHFIDLTEEDELEPYAHLLPEGMIHHRFPIKDVSVPKDPGEVDTLMTYIDDVLSSSPDAKVYVHCWGGVGRTGTIIGCYYVHKGCDHLYITAVVYLSTLFKAKEDLQKTWDAANSQD